MQKKYKMEKRKRIQGTVENWMNKRKGEKMKRTKMEESEGSGLKWKKSAESGREKKERRTRPTCTCTGRCRT